MKTAMMFAAILGLGLFAQAMLPSSAEPPTYIGQPWCTPDGQFCHRGVAR